MGRSVIPQVQGKAEQAQTQSQFLLETILHELQELGGTQIKETVAINQRLDKIEEAMGQIPAQLKEMKQRVSDLEDRSLGWDKGLNNMQKMLQESQNKIEDMENYARRLNLCFVEVPEGAENRGTTMLQFME
ncbi:hypothetical protein NDU88_003853 [Pleurodeles waltl]|uniref:Uncharacterized protein n=1 Tax=Pleurodeles waltl TaxID=8319 RepID=A0AAV7RF38_PLEWA|nr:hypothetical protein NDU88_003853 [Pleurodeles waltl]